MIVRANPAHVSVMVVDDDEGIRDCMKTLLESQGYDVVTAGNADEAWINLQNGPEPALILLDVMMPGMDGCQLRRRLQREPRLADIPVLLCSGSDNLADIAARIGVSAYVRKPVDVDFLLRVVARCCRERT